MVDISCISGGIHLNSHRDPAQHATSEKQQPESRHVIEPGSPGNNSVPQASLKYNPESPMTSIFWLAEWKWFYFIYFIHFNIQS